MMSPHRTVTPHAGQHHACSARPIGLGHAREHRIDAGQVARGRALRIKRNRHSTIEPAANLQIGVTRRNINGVGFQQLSLLADFDPQAGHPGKLLDESKSLNEGAIRHPAFAVGTNYWKRYAEVTRYDGAATPAWEDAELLFDPDKPLRDYSPDERELLLYGGGFRTQRPHRPHGDDAPPSIAVNDYEGLVPRFTRRFIKPAQ